MAIVSIRGLSDKGILRDPSPYQLDLNAWSDGSGMRFHANKAERAPIMRSVVENLPMTPQFAIGYRPPTGFDSVFIGANDGTVWKYANGATANVSATGFSPLVSNQAWTGTFMADVLYLNRPSGVPYGWLPNATAMAPLTGWSSTWTAVSLRGFQSYLIALNVTKGSTAFPAMVKWSDLALAGQFPGSWDQNDATTSAGENVLEELDTPIVDGLAMRNVFVIYSQNQIWAMEPSGDAFIFSFRRLFGNGGIIAPNCVTEVDGKHYVFGTNDIYVHDGVQKVSIVDKRNRDAIFRNLDTTKTQSNFVLHMPNYNDIMFAYNTSDPDAFYPRGAGCNKGAVYSTTTDTWSFIDLPNVTAGTLANLNGTLTYSTATAANTYAATGGSYWDQESGFDRNVVYTAALLPGATTQNRLLGYDFISTGSLSFPYSAECNAPAFLSRIGISLDQEGADLGAYKTVRRIFPQVSTFGFPVQIFTGSSLYPSGPVSWDSGQMFDPTTQYKLDVRTGGRYLAIKFSVVAATDFAVAGFDADVVSGGEF